MFSGAGAQALGAASNTQGARTAYRMQSQVNANNAQIAQWQAEDALLRGKRAASASRMKSNQLKGTQRARLAANGVDLGQGSALEILADTDFFGDMDADTIENNTAKEAWALRNQASNFRSESELMRYRARRENPFAAAGTSLLTSTGRMYRNS